MGDKIALQGFSRLRFFPVTKNDAESYKVDKSSSFLMPWAMEMTKEAQTSESKVYADDTLYLNVKNWNGLKTTITVAELTLEMMSTLGFGAYNAVNKTLEWEPQGKNKEFGVTFRCAQTNGGYRMMRMYSFKIDEIKEAGVKTKGESADINGYQLIGTFTKRVFDGKPGEIKDGAYDESWLNDIPDTNS